MAIRTPGGKILPFSVAVKSGNPVPSLTVDFSASGDPTSLTRSFSAQVSGGTGDYSYLWHFGDGDQSTAASPSHTFPEAADYEVVLVVTDTNSVEGTRTKSVTIADEDQVAVEEIRIWAAGVSLADSENLLDPSIGTVDEFDLDNAPNGIGLEATILDNGATFSKVEFYIDGQLVGSQGGAPYTYPGDQAGDGYFVIPAWGIGPGTYEIEARPYDSTDTVGVSRTVTLTIIQNAAPVAQDVEASTANSTLVNIDLSGGVSDTDGTVVEIEVVGSATNGSATVDGLSIDFTPSASDELGAIQYRAKDNLGKWSNVATITVVIGNYHEAPQLADFSVLVPENTATTIQVATRATDTTDGIDATSVVIESALSAGGVLTNPGDGTLLLTPTTDYNGPAVFQVSVADDNASPKRSRVATVYVQIGESEIQTLYSDYRKPLGGQVKYEIMAPGLEADWDAIASAHEGGNVINVADGATRQQVEDAIRNASAGEIVRLAAAGSYTWTGPVKITDSNRRVEIPADTVINMNLSPGWRQNAFQVSGGGPTGDFIPIVSGIGLHSFDLTLESAATLSSGDWLRIDVPFVPKTYSSAAQWNIGGLEVNRKSMVAQIVSISSNTVTLDRKVAMPPEWNLYPESAVVQKVNMIENVVIAGEGEISYTNLLGSTVGYTSIANRKPDWIGFGGSVMIIEYGYKCSVQGVTMRDTPTTMIWGISCSHFHVDGVKMLGTHNTSEGGCGYDVACEGLSVFKLENLYSVRTRHGSPASSLNRGNTCGDVHYSHLETNVDWHGAGDCLISVIVDEWNFWHDSNGFRHTDVRGRQTIGWNDHVIGSVTKSGTANYDSIFGTVGNGDLLFEAVPVAQHNPGFRWLPGSKYTGTIGPVYTGGHMETWIISTTGPWLVIINPGLGILKMSDVYGSAIIVPDPGGETLQRTIQNFKLSNSSKTNQGSVLIIGEGTNSITDFTSAYAEISDVGGNAQLDLGGGNYITLEGITKAELSETHIKVVDEDVLRYWQAHNYMRHFFLSDRPYIKTLSPMIGTENAGATEVSHTFNRAVTHNSGAGDGFILSEDGSVFLTLNPATHFTISGNKVTYQNLGLVSGNWYRFELPPNYFEDSSNQGIIPIYDWDYLERPPYVERNLHWWQA